MTLSQPQRIGLFILLALVMAGTRINHFSAMPDASWAVFLAAGFYLRGSMRWAFPALMALAVFVDFLVISSQGLSFWSHYCMSAAYWFLIPAYAAMWAGGSWLRSRYSGLDLPSLGMLAGVTLAATSLCFLVSNGSFYWLSDSIAARSLDGWMQNLADWYLPYLRTTAAWVCVGAAAHVIGTRWLRLLANQSQASGQRG
ncbi:hypothetical protein [Dokdonella sp.]|uniref:hypothetical protein n=1 Tax=Dokdonella sp. TaxID=2291710 RepID=UPI003C30FEFA